MQMALTVLVLAPQHRPRSSPGPAPGLQLIRLAAGRSERQVDEMGQVSE